MDEKNGKNVVSGEDKGIFYKKFIPAVIVAVFILIFLLQNHSFISRDVSPKFTDFQSTYSLRYYRHFHEKSGNTALNNIPYPPLTYVLTLPFIRGEWSLQAARQGLALFGIILLLSMFGIGYELGGLPGGISVMALTASSPHVLIFSREFFSDYPQTALTAMAFYLLIRADCYKNRRFSILAGAGIGVSLLAKWSAGFFLWFPILWFVMPHVFKNRRSVVVFAFSMILSAVYMMGTYWFIRHRAISGPENPWIIHYFLIIVLPTVIWCFLILRYEKKWNNGDGGYKSSPCRSVINFSLAIASAFITAGPWLFWAGYSINDKFTRDVVWGRDYISTGVYQLSFIKTMFSFLPLFVLAGMIFLFIRRKDQFRKLVLPLNIVVVFFFMMRVGHPATRYILSLSIFTAALGGYWTGLAGKPGKALTAFIVLISLISILAWTAFPADASVFHQVPYHLLVHNRVELSLPVKILTTMPPSEEVFNTDSLLERIKPEDCEEMKIVLLLSYLDTAPTEAPLNSEYLKLESLKKGMNIEFREINKLEDLPFIKKRCADSAEKISDFIILHRKDKPAMPAVEALQSLKRGIPFELTNIDISPDYQFVLVEFTE